MDRYSLAEVSTPFAELNDLKRIVSARRTGSIATRLFRDSWALLLTDVPLSVAGWWITARALAAARLGDVDASVLADAGLAAGDAEAVLMSAMDAVASPLRTDVRLAAREALMIARPVSGAPLPPFVDALASQPRAGLTCPGRPRIILEPPENHADHCLVVAVYGVILSPTFGADPGTVFLGALAHHFHNAGLPDSGFAGEMLLGRHLEPVMAHYTGLCLGQLPPALRLAVERARTILPDVSTPEGRAFHAADVIDRVLQILQYGQAGALTPGRMLDEMELVHAGPVKSFHDDVLRRVGLL